MPTVWDRNRRTALIKCADGHGLDGRAELVVKVVVALLVLLLLRPQLLLGQHGAPATSWALRSGVATASDLEPLRPRKPKG
eukprot:4395909-Alexandrium_andersonii.AAC.1